MCGIYGFASLRPDTALDPAALSLMAQVTVHRGPDDEGDYVGDEIVMGMRRLSIIDVAGGHQPIANEDESIWVVYNGEIYNFRELRRGDIDSMDRAFEVAKEGDGPNRLMRVDSMTQLPNDLLMLTYRMSIAALLKCRVPLLNHELVELAAQIPENIRIRKRQLKPVLKKACA